MTNKDFICDILGIYNGEWLDKIEQSFECTSLQTKGEMLSLLEKVAHPTFVGTVIASTFYREVIFKAERMYGAEFSSFDYVCEPNNHHLYYKKVEYTDWKSLEKALQDELKNKTI